MRKNGFVGIVLATDASPEAGSIRPLLRLGGKAVVRRLTDSFYAAGITRVFVVAGDKNKMLEPFVRNAETVYAPGLGGEFVTSLRTGISAALEYGDWDGVMFAASDRAMIRPYTMKLIMREFQPGTEPVIFPTFNGRRGYPPLLSRGMAEKLCAIESAQGGKTTLFSQGEAARDVEVGSADMFYSMDTPEGYGAMKAACARKAPTAVECEYMLIAERTPERVADHCRAVAEQALIIADDAMFAGFNIDKSVVFAAAMLHDIGASGKDGARTSAEIISQNGFPITAMAVSGCAGISERDSGKVTEASIVYLADMMTDGTAACTLEERLAAISPETRETVEGRVRKAAAIRDTIYKYK